MPNKQAVSFDAISFDDAIQSQGVELVHFRALRRPIGMIDQYDHRKPHDGHSNCSNGFIYVKAGDMRALFVSNSKQMQQADFGLLGYSSAHVSAPSFYDPSSCNGEEGKRIKVLPFDRFYLKDEAITVVHWQLFESHQSGFEKLSFPISCVQDLIDSNGKKYVCGIDFEISGGQIHWLSGNRPGYDVELGKGQVCSIRYEYRPYFYVSKMIHEVRVAQLDDPISGERKTNLMPQTFTVSREFVFEKTLTDPEAEVPNNPRQQKVPEEGGFGPR